MLWQWEIGCLREAWATEFQSQWTSKGKPEQPTTLDGAIRNEPQITRLSHLADNVSRHIPSDNEPKVDFEKIFTKFSRAIEGF